MALLFYPCITIPHLSFGCLSWTTANIVAWAVITNARVKSYEPVKSCIGRPRAWKGFNLGKQSSIFVFRRFLKLILVFDHSFKKPYGGCCLLACLLACLPACACLLACLFACLFACLLACLLACCCLRLKLLACCLLLPVTGAKILPKKNIAVSVTLFGAGGRYGRETPAERGNV